MKKDPGGARGRRLMAGGNGGDENKLIAERRAKLGALRAAGNAYPNDFRRDALAGQLHASYGERSGEWLDANPTHVSVGGRLLLRRLMGKASFAKIADRTGQIQLYLQQRDARRRLRGLQGLGHRRHPRRERRAVPYP